MQRPSIHGIFDARPTSTINQVVIGTVCIPADSYHPRECFLRARYQLLTVILLLGGRLEFPGFKAFRLLPLLFTIANELIDFLTNVFNAKAIPGIAALLVAQGNLASFTGAFKEFQQGLTVGLPEGGEVPVRILCPFGIEGAIIGIVISATKSTMIVYNWLSQRSDTR